MKITFKNCVYVQREDIYYLKTKGFNIPNSVFETTFSNNPISLCPSNRFEFVKFTKKEDIEFLESCEFIPEYFQMKKASIGEIINLFEQYQKEKNDKAKMYNSMSLKEKNENAHIVSQFKELNIRMDFLKDVLLYKQGNIALEIPEEIRMIERSETSGIKKMFKSIFKKNR